MSSSSRRRALVSGVVLSIAAGCGGFVVAGTAAAAAPTPESLTNCGGYIAPDPAGPSSGSPYLLDYKFHCNTDISAYTVLVDRRASDTGNIDDFDASPEVLLSDGATPSTSESLTCEGTLPSNGVNCNAGAGGVLSAYYFADGSVDLTDAYCKHLPAKARPGTPAIPQAIVQVVVTDNTGAEDGPFQLGVAKPCRSVPNFVPAPKPKTKHKVKRRRRG